MLRPEDVPGFVYHGSAFALGGEVTRPFSEVLEVQAGVSLPTSGGYATARKEKFHYREIVSFERAYSQVTGSSRGGSHDTLITVTVEGLNILEMVTADKVVGRIAASHGGSGRAEEESSLLPIGSYFVNLRIAGVPVNVRPNELLMRKGKMADIEGSYAGEEAPFVDPDGGRFQFAERSKGPMSHGEGKQGGGSRHHRRYEDCFLVTSIFQRPELKTPGVEVSAGGTIVIPDFGRVTLGKYIITKDSRRLTMIECQLGCAIQAMFSTGGVEGNGSPP